jgi:hypothetical protein
MIWYGFANKGNPVACEDMFEGNGRDPDLRDALNEAIAEYERATVRGIAVEPIVKRGGE